MCVRVRVRQYFSLRWLDVFLPFALRAVLRLCHALLGFVLLYRAESTEKHNKIFPQEHAEWCQIFPTQHLNESAGIHSTPASEPSNSVS